MCEAVIKAFSLCRRREEGKGRSDFFPLGIPLPSWREKPETEANSEPNRASEEGEERGKGGVYPKGQKWEKKKRG